MPCFSSQTLSAAKSSAFVRARVPGAGRDSSFGVGTTAFDGLFGLRPTFRRPERGADALAGLGMARGGSGGEMSLAPSESAAAIRTLGAGVAEVAKPGRVAAISALDKAPNFMCIRTREIIGYSSENGCSRPEQKDCNPSPARCSALGEVLTARAPVRCESPTYRKKVRDRVVP